MKGWANVWSQEKRLRPNSESMAMLKDHMIKSTLDWDWHWEHSVPAQSPACTQRPMKLLWRNVGWIYPCITIWKLMPALTTQHNMHCMNLTEPLEICRPNMRGGMTRPPAPAISLKVEAAMASAEINAELVCPLGTTSFPPGTHDFDTKRHDLIEGVSKFMISREEAQAKLNEYHEAQGSHDEVYTDGSKMNERVGAAAVINRHFEDGETTCRIQRVCNMCVPNSSLTQEPILLVHRVQGPDCHKIIICQRDAFVSGSQDTPILAIYANIHSTTEGM